MYSCLLVGLAVAVGAPGTKEAPKEKGSIVGEWVGEKGVAGGKERPIPEGGVRFTFTADGKVTIQTGKKEGETATYKVDAKKDPAEIDVTPPPGKGDDPIKGIYKVDGDTLTLCIAGGKDAERPAKFESPEGSRTMLMTLKRAKKDKE